MGQNAKLNLQRGPRTQLVRGIYAVFRVLDKFCRKIPKFPLALLLHCYASRVANDLRKKKARATFLANQKWNKNLALCRFAPATNINFEFWTVRWIGLVLCDYWFYNTQLKTALRWASWHLTTFDAVFWFIRTYEHDYLPPHTYWDTFPGRSRNAFSEQALRDHSDRE